MFFIILWVAFGIFVNNLLTKIKWWINSYLY
jgi:hypothetical protein